MIHFLSSLAKSDIRGKTFLVRVDLNIAPHDVDGSYRFERALVSLRYILVRGGRVIVVSHRGRPEPIDPLQASSLSKSVKKESLLKPFVTKLSRALGESVVHLDFFDFPRLKDQIRESDAKVFLLENIRLHPREEMNCKRLSRSLASLADVYVNDAFSASHRAHTSVAAVVKFLPAYAGIVFEEELVALNDVLEKPISPFVLVLGGAKISDKIGVLRKLGKRADYILTGGGIANSLLALEGVDVKDSVAEKNSGFAVYARMKNLILPVDVLWEKDRILDVGPEAGAYYASIIQTAGTVVWNGPMGLSEKTAFSRGTRAVLDGIRASKAHAVIGGGETTAYVLARMKGTSRPKHIFLSTGGGAMLEYLSGKTLPGVRALEQA